jgi:ribosomal protein S18
VSEKGERRKREKQKKEKTKKEKEKKSKKEPVDFKRVNPLIKSFFRN